MSHEISRLLRAAGHSPWAIEPGKAREILAVVEMRAQGLTRAAAPERDREREEPRAAGSVAVIPLMGVIMPRADLLSEVSGAQSLAAFQREFQAAAANPDVSAIVIEVDSPGGQVDLVPETAAMIRAARGGDRPIVAVANTVAASAAYWIASAADELVVTPSGLVGSIGVFTVHEDVSEALAMEGVAVTYIYEGARKVEGNPFEPLDPAAKAAVQARIRDTYESFTGDVAAARGVPLEVVQADPEAAERHMGGGRALPAAEALALGMVDRVETLDATIQRLATRRSERARRRAALR